jgi:hypothetical protein
MEQRGVGEVPTMPKRSTRIAVIYAGLAAGAAVLVLLRPMPFSAAQAFFAALIVIAGVLPTVWFSTMQQQSQFPVMPVAGLFYAVFFGASLFLMSKHIWPDYGYTKINLSPFATGDPARQDFKGFWYYLVLFRDRADAAPLSVLALTAAGVALFTASFVAARRALSGQLRSVRFIGETPVQHLEVLVWGLLGIHCLYELFPAVRSVPSLGQLATPAGYAAFGMFLVLWHRGEIGPLKGAAVFGAVLPVLLAVRFAQGLLSPMLVLGLFLVIVVFRLRPKLTGALVGFGIVSAVIAYPSIHQYRAMTWEGSATRLEEAPGPVEKILAVATLTRLAWSRSWRESEYTDADGQDEYTDAKTFPPVGGYPTLILIIGGRTYPVSPIHPLSVIAKRIATLPMLSHVYRLMPDRIPYLGGRSYAPLATSFVPRAVWPGKPRETFGGEFGRTFGFLVNDTNTSVNVPWIVELFVNFGGAGILAGMTVFGLLLAVLDRLFNDRSAPILDAVIGLTVIFPFAYPESNFSLKTGSMLPLAVFLFVYFRLGTWVLAHFEKPQL